LLAAEHIASSGRPFARMKTPTMRVSLSIASMKSTKLSVLLTQLDDRVASFRHGEVNVYGAYFWSKRKTQRFSVVKATTHQACLEKISSSSTTMVLSVLGCYISDGIGCIGLCGS
jgi:hypothetical protein